MAKISKKPPVSPLTEMAGVNRDTLTGLEAAGLFSHSEPVIHIPNVDMFCTGSDLVIEVEMPGVRKDAIDISLTRNTITIKALKVERSEEDKINYVCMERSFGRIMRTVDMPCPVDTAKIKAVYKNGILTITLPMVKDMRQETKRIKIESN